MTIERAVVKGTMLDLVDMRSMFTCDVVPSGGDTALILWEAYLTSMYDAVENMTSDTFATYEYELQTYTAGSWVPYDTEAFVHVGASAAEAVANAVSLVLIGKAAGLRKMGRKFIGGLSEDIILGNFIAPAQIANAAACLAAYVTPFTGIGGGTIEPGIVDKTGTFHPFVGGIVSTILGSMRKRKPGIGI